MADPSNAKLRDFQVGLSAQGQAEISPEVTREVYQTLQMSTDLSTNKLRQMLGHHLRTMQRYVSGYMSPTMCVFVRDMNRMGYTVHLVKKDGTE